MISYSFYSLNIFHVCRLKVQTQLISWLNKHDTDIGEKQTKYDEVLAGFEEEKRQMEELMVKERFDLQDNKLSMTIFINSNNSHYA
jgi:hypothetical protein